MEILIEIVLVMMLFELLILAGCAKKTSCIFCDYLK